MCPRRRVVSRLNQATRNIASHRDRTPPPTLPDLEAKRCVFCCHCGGLMHVSLLPLLSIQLISRVSPRLLVSSNFCSKIKDQSRPLGPSYFQMFLEWSFTQEMSTSSILEMVMIVFLWWCWKAKTTNLSKFSNGEWFPGKACLEDILILETYRSGDTTTDQNRFDVMDMPAMCSTGSCIVHQKATRT